MVHTGAVKVNPKVTLALQGHTGAVKVHSKVSLDGAGLQRLGARTPGRFKRVELP